MSMMYYEWKKVWRSRFWLKICIASLFFCLGTWYVVCRMHGVYDEAMIYQTSPSKIQEVMQRRKLWNGTLDDAYGRKLCAYLNHLKTTVISSHIEHDEPFPHSQQAWQEVEPIATLFLQTGMMEQKNDSFTCVEHVIEIFENNRLQSLEQEFHQKNRKGEALYPDAQITRMRHLAKQVTGTGAYEDATAYLYLLSYMKWITLLTLILTVVLSASLYTQEEQYEVASFLYSSKYGRTKGIMNKNIVLWLSVTILYLFYHFLFAMLMFSTYGYSGTHIPIQYTLQYWLSLFPFTMGQAYLFSLFLGYCACILVMVYSSILSKFVTKSHISLSLSLGFLLLPYIVDCPILNIPKQMSEGASQLIKISIHSRFSFPLFLYEQQILITGLTILCLILFIFSFRLRYHPMLIHKSS